MMGHYLPRGVQLALAICELIIRRQSIINKAINKAAPVRERLYIFQTEDADDVAASSHTPQSQKRSLLIFFRERIDDTENNTADKGNAHAHIHRRDNRISGNVGDHLDPVSGQECEQIHNSHQDGC